MIAEPHGPQTLPDGAKVTDLLRAPRGTVMAHPVRPGYYFVRGSEKVREVYPGDVSGRPAKCACRGFVIRGDCFHVQRARAVRDAVLISGQERRGDRPDPEWLCGVCPACGSDCVSNCYYLGGRGYLVFVECWEALGESPRCHYRHVR